MNGWLKDVRHGARVLGRQKGFTAAAALSLAVGVGLNTTVFSVVNAVLLRDSLLREPEALVEVYSSPSEEFPHLTTSYPDYLELRDGVDAFADVAAHAMVRGILTSGGNSDLVVGEVASANYFDVLGIPPAMGRGFLAEEDRTEGTHPVIVISDGLWQRRLGGRPDVLGSALRLSNIDYTVVGIAPRGFTGTIPGFEPEFWVPTMMVGKLSFSGIQSTTGEVAEGSRLQRRGQRWLFVKGRLAEGQTIEQARAQVETLFARLRQEYPESNEDVKAALLPAASVRFHPMLDGYVRAASALLLVAVSLVLVIACANVANMLLARGVARRREFAVRAAIGASRGRLVRQLLAESVVLAGVGGGLGLLIAYGSGKALAGLGSDTLPIPLSFSFDIDVTVLLYAFGVALATALLFGLAPALAASRPDLVPALKADATGDGSDRRRFNLRNTLVVAQLATSLVLLVAGALLGRGLLAAQATDLGYDPTPIAALSFNLQMNGYEEDASAAFQERALERLRALPGVEAAAFATRLPLAPDINMDGVRVPGHHGPEDDAAPIDAVAVGPDYFAAVGIPIIEGRGFTEADRAGAPRVVVINETMARRYWPDGDAVGQRLYRSEYDDPPYLVVGVSSDHKVRSVGEEPRPYMHTSWLEDSHLDVGLVVRISGAAQAALPMLKRALLELEPELVFTEETTAAQVAEVTVAPTRIGALILGAFGALALALAAVGLFGVISYSVTRRTREVGVRMALGARRSDVLWLVLQQGLKLALVGVVAGALVSALVARVLESLLYGVSALDPVAYAAAALTLLVVGALANAVPAWRASRIDPMRALRSE